MNATRSLRCLLPAVAMLLVRAAAACPGCRDALATPAGAAVVNPWGAAYGWSIIFMLGMVLSLCGIAVYKVSRIVKAENARAAAPNPIAK